MPQPVAPTLPRRLDPHMLASTIRAAGVTHVVTVPDTHQKSLLSVLADHPDIDVVTVCTEDEAVGINVGLYLGGQQPLLLIQNAGFFACLNSIRGMSLDARVPVCLLIGEYGRNPELLPADNPARAVSLLEPTLRAWTIPSYRLDRDEDIPNILTAVQHAAQIRGPVALLVGSPTAELQ